MNEDACVKLVDSCLNFYNGNLENETYGMEMYGNKTGTKHMITLPQKDGKNKQEDYPTFLHI